MCVCARFVSKNLPYPVLTLRIGKPKFFAQWQAARDRREISCGCRTNDPW